MSHSLIYFVVNMGDSAKVMKSAKKYGIENCTVSIGRGTVSSKILEFLGLNDTRKEIITMIAENEAALKTLGEVSREMSFEKANHGIAFSHRISELFGGKNNTGFINPDSDSDSENKSGESGELKGRDKVMYKLIYAVVDKGRGEDVIDAANKAGSRGGTIINARGAGAHEVRKFFSVEIEPEREETFIIAKEEQKEQIVRSIRDNLKIDEPGNGLLFVLDVDEVYGLH